VYPRYYHVSRVPWRIITASGLDDWLYWHLYYNLSYSQSIIALSLIYPLHKSLGHAPFSFSFSFSFPFPFPFPFSFSLLSSQSHIATDGQSVSKSWCRAPSGTHDQIFSHYYLTVTVLFLWGALSDERTSLSLAYAAGLCQRSFSRVRVPYFTVSDLRLPFSSPSTARRVTVDRIEVTTSSSSSIIVCLFVAAETCLPTRYQATDVLLLRT
jgi:hypothetical protein